MASTISAGTSAGTAIAIAGDTSGVLELQSNGTTTALTINTSQGVKVKNTLGVGDATPSTSGAGITFPATQSASTDANTLDDYEEGTWTPTYQPQFGSFTSVTYAGSRYGSYTKIGRMVVLNFDIGTNAITVGTGSGAIRIAGLPFTAGSNTAYGNGLFASEKWSTNNPLGVKALGGNALMELMYKSSVTGNSAELAVTSAGTGSDSNYARATIVYFV
jgi:hypothetical protein